MTQHVEISEEELRRASELRASGVAWASIARVIGKSDHQIRKRLDPDYSERHRVSGRRRYKEITEGPHMVVRTPVPAEVTAERSRAYDPRVSRSVTADFCGDPPAGRSALDMRNDSRNQGANSTPSVAFRRTRGGVSVPTSATTGGHARVRPVLDESSVPAE